MNLFTLLLLLGAIVSVLGYTGQHGINKIKVTASRENQNHSRSIADVHKEMGQRSATKLAHEGQKHTHTNNNVSRSIHSRINEDYEGSLEDEICPQAGDIMHHTTHVTVLWYGCQPVSDNLENSNLLLGQFIGDLGISNWWQIVREYFDPYHYDINHNEGPHVKDLVLNGIHNYCHYAHGHVMNDNTLHKVLKDALADGFITGSPDEIVVIMLDRNVNYPGQCEFSCAFHWDATVSDINIKYALIGNPYVCADYPYNDFAICSALAADGCNAPNNNAEIDSMINLVAHELAETVTDPYGDGWIVLYDNDNDGDLCYENGDLCAWDFGEDNDGDDPWDAFWNGNGWATEAMTSSEYYIQHIWAIGCNSQTQGSPPFCSDGWAGCASGASWLNACD